MSPSAPSTSAAPSAPAAPITARAARSGPQPARARARRRRTALVGLVAAAALAGGGLVAAAPHAAHAGALPVTLTVQNLVQTVAQDPTTEADFSWHTARTTTTSAPQPQTVLDYGPAQTFTCDGASAAIPATALYDRVSYFHANLTGLEPGTAYRACVADPAAGSATATFTFSTRPAAPSSFTFLATANPNWRSTASYANYYGNVLVAARAAYPDAAFATVNGTVVSSVTDRAHWDGLGQDIGAADVDLPLAPTAAAAGSANRYFELNTGLATTGTYDTANYAVRYGDALLLNINTRLTTTAQVSATTAWIAAQAAAAPAGTWLIASLPTSFFGTSQQVTSWRGTIADALEAAGVALVLQGETPAYVRTYPVAGRVANKQYPSSAQVSAQDGAVYLAPGSAGEQQVTPTTAANWASSTGGWAQVSSAFGTSTGQASTALAKKMYSAITVSAGTLQVNATTIDGTFTDHFTIQRGPLTATRPAAAQVAQMSPLGLNTGFGTDAATQRTITWLTLHTLGLQTPVVTYAASCADLAAADQTGQAGAANVTAAFGRTARTASYMSAYDTSTVTLTGLDPGATYCYELSGYLRDKTGAFTTEYRSARHTFETAQADPSQVTFLDFADSQGPTSSYAEYWGNTVAAATAAYPDAAFATHTGDMVDANTSGHVTNFLAATGDTFGQLPFYAVLGNHEGTTYSQMFGQIFPQDAATTAGGPAAPYPMMYAVAYGPVLVLGLNSNETSQSEIAETAAWVRAEIAANGTAPDGAQRFVICEEHKSPYGGKHAGDTVTSAGTYGAGNLRKYLQPALSQAGVDLVLAGHDHNYIRSFPIHADGTFGSDGDSSVASTD
ncbi:MAG: metallophosphoesterase family protein, partial [Bifidobacteriaceae bacterium]|nr:metallophosphoesterase family protein [Bifidobacteriaceae bacterium]